VTSKAGARSGEAVRLPAGLTACLFDLDGVLTQTARVHAAAWKAMFDELLRERAARTGEPFQPFDRPTDYDEYVDGKPRLDGVRSFLESRGDRAADGLAGGSAGRGDDPCTRDAEE
jgi:beta-phosphoglucomutase-like phosphatase (HAD superfamily)